MPQNDKVLLKITNLKQYFPVAKKGMYVKYVRYWADLEGGLEDTFYRCDNGMCKGALVL